MSKYTLFLLAAIGILATATAITAIAAGPTEMSANAHNVTVVEKNQAFPVYGPITVETCAVEDCSDTTS
jgi:hypothetical protein